MKFLCRGPSIPLEDLCDKCHLFAARSGSRLDPAQCIDVQADTRFRERSAAPEGCRMLDAVMLAIGLGFFALSVGYTIACDRL
jgi:hypothetical protein